MSKQQKKKLTDVWCYYTGGGIWVYSARYGDVWIYGSTDQGFDCFVERGEKVYDEQDVLEFHGIENDFTGDPDNSFAVPADGIYPTYREILKSTKDYPDSSLWQDEIEYLMTSTFEDLSKTINE